MLTNGFYVTLVIEMRLFMYFVQIPLSGYVGLVVLDAGGARGRLAGDSRLLQSRLDHPDLLVLTSRSSVQEHSLHSTKNTVKTYGFVQFPFSDHVPNKKLVFLSKNIINYSSKKNVRSF